MQSQYFYIGKYQKNQRWVSRNNEKKYLGKKK